MDYTIHEDDMDRLLKMIQQNFFWKNTMESIGTQVVIPDIEEEVRLYEFSDVERAMYKDASKDSTRLRQICCHPQISDYTIAVLGESKKTLEEIRVMMIEQKEKELAQTRKLITRNENDLLFSQPYMHASIHSQIKTLKEEERRLASVLAYFNEIIPSLANVGKKEGEEVDCLVCLEPIEEVTITACGHLFHLLCIQECIKKQGKCPMCRKVLKGGDYTEMAQEKENGKEEDQPVNLDLDKLIATHGTKMAHLILFIRGLQKDDRVIIFSQWDKLLAEVGQTLKAEGIGHVYCKGNVHMRNKAIETFKKNKVQAIMLSLENAASGTNLIEASHVVLLDPISESKEKAQAIEAQAIGRAHRQGQTKGIKVIRMIIKDTVEHELYLRNSAQ
jgi:SNF2 family DNA or RNA helicase